MTLTEPSPIGESAGLTPPQRQRLRAHAITSALAVLGFLLTLSSVVAVLAAKLRDPLFASRGQLWLLLPLAAFWLWRLAPAFGRLQRVRRDLRANRLAWVEGPLYTSLTFGFGLFKTVNHLVRVGGWHGRVSSSDFQHLQPGAPYRVCFAPHSRTFLGAAPLDQPLPGSQPAAVPLPGADAPLPAGLTQREIELLRLVAAGLSNKEIAARLSLSPNTIKMYNSVVYEKLGVRRRTEAVARAREMGLL